MEISQEAFEKLKQLKTFKGRIVSDSMEPVIKTGEEISIEVGATNLSRFDILVFHYEGKLMCHYLWQMNRIVQPVLFQTRSMKGILDMPVPFDRYLGKVTSHRLSFWRRLQILFFNRS